MPSTTELDLTDIQDQVIEEALHWGAEAFDGRPERFETNLNDLLDTNDPWEYINFLGYNSFSEYMADNREE